MTDPNTPTTPTNPQDLIDQALGTATPTVTPTDITEPTLPTPEPLSPPPAAEPTVEQQKPEEVVAAPTTETVPVELTTSQPEPMAMPEPPKETKPMGEDMPLAFATATPADTMTTTPPEPYVEPVNTAVVPPILAAPTSSPTPKKRTTKKLLIALGLSALVGVLSYIGYGSYGYLIEPAKIANVGSCPDTVKWCREPDGDVVKNPNYDPDNPDNYRPVEDAPDANVKPGQATKDQCHGCSNGGWLVWRDGECKVTGICDSGVPGKDTENPMEVTEKPATGCSSSNASTCCGAGYLYCGTAINKCVSLSALEGKGCNGYGLEVYGIAINYGATAFKGTCDSAKVSSGLQTSCNCGSGNVCFERRGDCFLGSGDGNSASDYAANVDSNPNNDNPNIIARSDGSYVNMGLCGLVSSYKPTKDGGNISENTKFFEKAECFECGEDGCKIKTGLTGASADKCYGANGCTTVRYTCDETKSGVSCLENKELLGNNATFKAGCGTVEQVDVMCGGQYIASRTRINPECTEDDTPNPSTPPTITTNPTLMCTSLTRTPTTTPAIGDKITFTCAGASTPAGAVSLNYKFRYSINSGNYVTLTNKTATTSELTIAQCGSYKVQCQACGTINGVLTCDPTWTGATAQ